MSRETNFVADWLVGSDVRCEFNADSVRPSELNLLP